MEIRDVATNKEGAWEVGPKPYLRTNWKLIPADTHTRLQLKSGEHRLDGMYLRYDTDEANVRVTLVKNQEQGTLWSASEGKRARRRDFGYTIRGTLFPPNRRKSDERLCVGDQGLYLSTEKAAFTASYVVTIDDLNDGK